jgi:hypothetical protein
MFILQLISLLINLSGISSISKSLSAMSFLLMSTIFLFAVLNIDFTLRDIKIFLTGLLLFVIVNAAFQIYQFLYFADGDNDMTLGLLMSTTPSSILAFVVALFYLNGVNSRKITLELVLVVVISLIQILSAYVKGMLSFAAVVIVGLRRSILQRYGITLIVLVIVGLGILSPYLLDSDTSYNYAMLEYIDNIDIVLQLGPVKVWTNFITNLKSPVNIFFGYGPGSYGSVNTVDDEGFSLVKLGSLMDTGGPSMSTFFSQALSSAGNIVWENGIIVFVLFFYIYYKIYRESSLIFRRSKIDIDCNYAFGVKYGIIFIVLLMFLSLAVTTEEILLWGPGFVVFSYLKNIPVDAQI